MKDFKARVSAGEVLFGCFLNLGSSLTAEIVGSAGFDWVLLDLEHGAGGERELLFQLQALEHTGAAAVVRVESGAKQRIHRVLDLGAHGVMIPRVDTADEAEMAVAGLRYPPDGVRGVATMNRACGFGANAKTYMSTANQALLGIVQIESEESLRNIDAIAATDGADVLFVGPSDLTYGMGIPGQVDHPRFRAALDQVAAAAARAGKVAGCLLLKREEAQDYVDLGYSFLCCSSDGGLLAAAARDLASTLAAARAAIPAGAAS
jgi:2-keto-3-deoxy-L-rhamnonate aldolase RhmA